MNPAVHPVGNAGEAEVLFAPARLRRAQLRGFGKVQLKIQRFKV